MTISRSLARPARRLIVSLLVALGVLVASPAEAQFPFGQPPGADPYAYENYMFTTPAQYPPSDLGGDAYKYFSGNSCELDGPGPSSVPPGPNTRCDPAINANPQELFGVTGASIDKSWETTTGRPDVVIAVHDSGIKWNDGGFLVDLNNKTWLNRGELPVPDWGSPHPSDPHDRNNDGIFNMLDYCANPPDELNCGGAGDSRVRGASTSNDTDYNANGWIDPEDLIFRFSDGVDDDGNGYVDDFVGWDTYEDDNDPFDEVQYGHGTGEARDSTAEVNNGGDAGVCPNCMVMHMRVGDSFVADVNDFAQGVLYATDNGASVIQSALGTLNNSRFAQEAIDYAYRRGVVLIASAADESAGHHNQPSVLEHGVTFNAIGEPESPVPAGGIASYLEFRGCTNYGAYITAAVPANSCSSEAVGRTSGMAGLIYGGARNEVAKGNIDDYSALNCLNSVTTGRGVSAEEVDQIISTTADDINFITPVLYTARPDLGDTERYPASEGWDPFFGYGRVNAKRMVTAVAQNKIPPEADITSPKWFATIDPDDGPVEIHGSVASCRSDKYSYNVKWGVWSWRQNNAAPSYTTQGVTLSFTGDQMAPHSGLLATIDPIPIQSRLVLANGGAVGAADGPAVDPATGRGDHENLQYPDKFGIIVQLEVTSKDSAGTPLLDIDGQPLTGIGTKNFNFHDDPALFPGFPINLGGDGAASPRFADIDDDGADELIVATSDGEVHAYESAGGEVSGWPVALSPLPAYGGPAYSSGEITPPHAAVLRSPSIGDIDRNGDLEIVVGDFEGRLWVLEDDGSVRAGFPKRANPDFSYPRPDERAGGYYASASHPNLVPGDYPGPGALPNSPDLVPDLVNRRSKINRTTRWFIAAPTLVDLDGTDADLEIIAPSGDRHIYVYNPDGSAVAGWPVFLRDNARLDGDDSIKAATHRVVDNDSADGNNSGQIVVSVAAGDINGDGTREVLATANEQYVETPNTDEPLPSITGFVLENGNNRLYAVYRDGADHGGGQGSPPSGHPNVNAYLPGWPASIATLAIDLLPVVGEGPDGPPVIANVNGGIDLETGIFGTAGPAYILNSAGDSIYGQTSGRDRTLLMDAPGGGANSADVPAIPAVGGGIFAAFQAGQLVFAAPSAGVGKLVDLALPEDQLQSDNHLSVWELGDSRSQVPAFPREVNDLQFLSTPASADITGDGQEELLNGSAYSDLHAFTAAGTEPGLNTLSPDGWPKFTGGWTVGPPAVGDFDGNGTRDIAHSIREGRLYVWNSNGADVCDPASWPEFGHDGWNTNNFHTDSQRPRVVSDLASSLNPSGTQITLSWAAPGDDGRCGQATQHQVRRSTSPITTDNFAAATLVTAGAPGAPGSAESATINRLQMDYYFAVRAVDDAGNPGAVSNVVFVEGLDGDGDGVNDLDEVSCGGDPNDGNIRPERVDGPFAAVSDDGDAQIDEPLPPGSSGFDCDGDGYKGTVEDHVFDGSGGRDQDACGADGWPAELASGGPSANAITLTDLSSFIAPFRRLGTSPGDPDFDLRWDLVPGSPSPTLEHIILTDMANLILTRPPMLGGLGEFGGPVCPWPP